MLVVEKIFGIKIEDDSKKEYLCGMLADTHCFDKKEYKVNDGLDCDECLFFDDENGRCQRKIYEWLLSEYKEDHEDGCEG